MLLIRTTLKLKRRLLINLQGQMKEVKVQTNLERPLVTF